MVRSRKGEGLTIRSLALIALGVMAVVLVYGMTSGWFEDLGLRFVNSIDYPSQ